MLSANIADWFMVRWVYPAPSPPGDPCTPRLHVPGYAYPPLSPGGRPCLGMW